MFEWLFGNKLKKLEKKTHNSFSDVKKDVDAIGKWIKHLDERDKQLFDSFFTLKEDLSSLETEVSSLKEAFDLLNSTRENKQPFKKLPVLAKQTPDDHVENIVQTAVQTDNFYDIFKKLSSNERLVFLTVMNSDMKLSYEDIAMLLGKERSTIRGQINSIKQKSENLISEIIEKSGKKRVFVPEDIKKRLQKYAKVRVRGEENGD